MKTLHSTEDASVNFVWDGPSVGSIEARYVRRSEDYFIVYLSSQTGCAKGCKFCHLTATRQTRFENLPASSMLEQAAPVFAHYQTQPKAEMVHFNWMARGEALSNPNLLSDNGQFLADLGRMAASFGVTPRYKISTIMPREVKDLDLATIFGAETPDLYYSLYSLDPAFRKEWMPAAIDPALAVRKLAHYQRKTGGTVHLHWTFIEGVNDSIEGLRDICDLVEAEGLKTGFNLVRYNPYSAAYGTEPSEAKLQDLFDYMTGRLGTLSEAPTRIVPRVGFDVKASCGMFVEAA